MGRHTLSVFGVDRVVQRRWLFVCCVLHRGKMWASQHRVVAQPITECDMSSISVLKHISGVDCLCAPVCLVGGSG